jgi:hypothetical protein
MTATISNQPSDCGVQCFRAFPRAFSRRFGWPPIDSPANQRRSANTLASNSLARFFAYYELLAEMRGGMGIVFNRQQQNRIVALKVLVRRRARIRSPF